MGGISGCLNLTRKRVTLCMWATVYQLSSEYTLQQDDKTFKLETVDKEKDLEICVTKNMKAATQCKAAAQQAMNVLRTIKRHFFRIDEPTFLILYKSYVRPHLQYCVQVWSPHFRKDIACLEQVQKRATKLVSGFKNLSYED